MASRFSLATAFMLSLAATAPGCRTAPRATEPGGVVLRPGQELDETPLLLSSQEEQEAEAHARFAAGIVNELDDELPQALEHYRKAAESDPENERLLFEVVQKLVEARQLDEATKLLERAASQPDCSGMVYGWLGVIHALRGDRDAAIAANQEAIRRMPRSLAGYRNLAGTYLAAGQVPEALAVLENAARQPDTTSAFLIGLADVLEDIQNRRDARAGDLKRRIVALLDRASALKPEHPAELLRLGDLYQAAGETDRALRCYDQVLKQEPDLPGLREKLASIYLLTDNRAKAAEQLRAIARDQPTNPLPHFYLGVIALEEKNFDAAVDHFDKLLLLRPDNERIYYELAAAELSHDQATRALEVLNRARARFRPSFPMEFYSALAQLQLKDYSQAIRYFTAAEVIAGATEPGLLNHVFYFQAGVAYERDKRFEEAVTQFEKALELKPDFPDAMNYLGYMWAERGQNLEQARQLIERAVKLEPDNPAYIDSLAWVLHQLGQSAEALPHMLRAVKLSKDPDPTLFDHLGDIYRELGRPEDARQAWRRSLELEPNDAIEKKLQEPPPASQP